MRLILLPGTSEIVSNQPHGRMVRSIVSVRVEVCMASSVLKWIGNTRPGVNHNGLLKPGLRTCYPGTDRSAVFWIDPVQISRGGPRELCTTQTIPSERVVILMKSAGLQQPARLLEDAFCKFDLALVCQAGCN